MGRQAVGGLNAVHVSHTSHSSHKSYYHRERPALQSFLFSSLHQVLGIDVDRDREACRPVAGYGCVKLLADECGGEFAGEYF